MERIKADICVIGAGSAGLSVAAGAAQMGARTVLVEKAVRNGAMGGDCLHTGCVPSKALLAAAGHAQAMRSGAAFGVAATQPDIDFGRVHDHVHGVIASIAPMDSVARFEGLGVTVIQDHARFTGERLLVAGDKEIQARRFVIATGSRAAMPPIPGLADTPAYANETIFDLTECPKHLIVIGGGPIGMEMAQAHRRLGAEVTVIEGARVLGRDDPELAAIVADNLRREGVTLVEEARVSHISGEAGAVNVTYSCDGKEASVSGSHLLVATGRTPNVEGMGLEEAGVDYTPRGITVDDRLRTTNKKIFAIGDVAGGPQFTHVAGYHAGLVIRNALFRVPARVDHSAIPHVTYTDPELAHVGETEAEARERHSKISALRWHMAENDRAQADRQTEGAIKIVIDGHARVLGATIVGPHAGELILPWVMAMQQGLKLSAMAGYVVPYPTYSEVTKRVAGSYYTSTLFGPRTKALVRFLSWFG